MNRTVTCAVLVLAVACTKHDEQATSSVALQLPSATATAAASTVSSAPIVAGPPITSCTASFECGLSHPGLGSSSRTTSVDLGKCERARWSESGPYNPTSPRNPPAKTITKVSKADCDRLRDLAASLGPPDRVATMESAHMDSEACSLSIDCTGDADVVERFRVQRQTTTGGTRVEQTIRAVQGAP
ncbi:MAG TPA: hypothetical protein VGH87_22935 [Polyangiaceae bacterium]